MGRPHLFGRYLPPNVAQDRQNATLSKYLRVSAFAKKAAILMAVYEVIRAAAFGRGCVKTRPNSLQMGWWTTLAVDRPEALV